MQGTIPGKFPPNLLKLFAPRPPPTFIKPLGRDPHEPGPNKLDGVAEVLKRLHAENEEKMLTEAEGKEKGFTLAREYQRQLKREEKKKQKEEYKKNLEKNCT
jgi:U1 small nuclear ribonucleoprotein